MSEVCLYFFPSPLGISWRAPVLLTLSGIANWALEALFKVPHAIGHVSIEILHAPTGRRVLTGMTSANRRERVELLWRKHLGLGVLFHAFAGRLETEAEIERQLPQRFRSGTLSFLRIGISDQTAQRLMQYFDEFCAADVAKNYGFPCRPRFKEGGGCSEFAMSFLEVGGLLQTHFIESWRRSFLVPQRLIGGAHAVGLRHLLCTRSAYGWATSASSGQELLFWDPDRMHLWVNRTWHKQNKLAPGARTFGLLKKDQARGLFIDMSGIPAPQGPIWLG